ncbi:MAG TPA: hypothetical protein VGE45_02820 [Chloroflexia bacterium]|jgi:hypothetical protein
MNLNALEKMARQALKGTNIVEKSNMMAVNGYLSPAEHRSLASLSWQIAANVQADGGAAAGTYAMVRPNRIWF